MDTERLQTQQDFLKALAAQMLTINNLPKVKEWSRIFSEEVETNLKLSNIVWLGQQLMQINSEDINFSRIPADDFLAIRKVSYVNIYEDEWLTLINSSLNPFFQEITKENLDLLIWDKVSGQGVTSAGTIVPESKFASAG
jgi:anionic cell wall polymer biosynthesis LytR-Cps2A-Psr (LCP) family protein